MMIRQQMVCVIYVYGPQTGGAEAERGAFREEIVAGLGDGQTTMLCVVGDFNAHIGVVEPGDEASIVLFGWGTRDGTRQSSTYWWCGSSSSGGRRTAKRWRASMSPHSKNRSRLRSA